MKTGCQERRAELILASSEPQPFVPALQAHLEACVECRDFARRARQVVELTRSLSRVVTPHDLDGRVVASIQQGFREERSVRHLATLPRLNAPTELEESLTHSEQIAEDLRARVAQELIHPELGIGRRLARVAHRMPVPRELELRVAHDLEQPPIHFRSRKRLIGTLSGGLVLLAAAAVITWVNLQPEAPVRPELHALSFKVREVDSVTELNSMARAMISGVTGGASEAREF